MPGFALFIAVEADKFKGNLNLPVQCTSSGHRVQPPRMRQENDIIGEVVIRRRFVGKAAMARALRRKGMVEAPERPDPDDEL